MPSIINSDNGAVSGSAGLKFDSADDGILQIQNNGNTAMTVSAAGITTFASQPVVPVPAFRARAGTSQSVTNDTATLINLTVEDFDTHSWFDNVTDYKFNPQTAGYYFLRGFLWSSANSQSGAAVYLYKNGATYDFNITRGILTNVGIGVQVTSTVYMNGSTDYVQLYGLVSGTNTHTFQVNAGLETWATSKFEGFLVRAA